MNQSLTLISKGRKFGKNDYCGNFMRVHVRVSHWRRPLLPRKRTRARRPVRPPGRQIRTRHEVPHRGTGPLLYLQDFLVSHKKSDEVPTKGDLSKGPGEWRQTRGSPKGTTSPEGTGFLYYDVGTGATTEGSKHQEVSRVGADCVRNKQRTNGLSVKINRTVLGRALSRLSVGAETTHVTDAPHSFNDLRVWSHRDFHFARVIVSMEQPNVVTYVPSRNHIEGSLQSTITIIYFSVFNKVKLPSPHHYS